MRTVLIALSAALVCSGAVPVQAAPPWAQRILFVGNSFNQGAHSAVKRYRADTVTDLNGDGYGGVPALFKTFAEQVGQMWLVSQETQGGQSLQFHYDQRRARISGANDVVVLQEYSTLDRRRPGDPSNYRANAERIAMLATAANPDVTVLLMATWSRADLAYRTPSAWTGKPIEAMAADLERAARVIDRASPQIDGVIPVGAAWTRAMRSRFADANPYDGIAFGQVNLWTYDHYHGSVLGYYLEALIVFGQVTGIDPRKLGSTERAADDLGISMQEAESLQQIAHEELISRAPLSGR